MNENHQRRLVATFRHVDKLLGEAGHILGAADSASPFAECTPDASPAQRQVIDDYIARVREVMIRVMTDLNLPRPAPVCGALWAAQARIGSAQIAVAEIRPKNMLGYGPLSDADAKAINDLVAELNAALARVMASLVHGSNTDLPARLKQFEQMRDELRQLLESDEAAPLA
jgi:hypothetical protein